MNELETVETVMFFWHMLQGLAQVILLAITKGGEDNNV